MTAHALLASPSVNTQLLEMGADDDLATLLVNVGRMMRSHREVAEVFASMKSDIQELHTLVNTLAGEGCRNAASTPD